MNVTICVLVPEQEFFFEYDEAEWNKAVTDDRVADLIDHDVSDMDIYEQIIDPQGNVMEGVY